MLQVLQKMEERLDRAARSAERVGRSGRQAGRETESAFQAAVRQTFLLTGALTGVGGVVSGILQAVQTLRREHEELVNRQKAAEFRTLTGAEAVRRARVAFIPDATLADQDLESTLQGIGQRTRSQIQTVAAATTSAFSAKGDLSNQVALQAVEQALRLLPEDLETATTLSGRALDIAKLTGSRDIAANIGFIQNVQQAARVTSLEKVGATSVRAINAVVQAGGTAEQGAELFAAATQLTGDEEGRLTSTGVARLAEQLSKFVPQRVAREKDPDFGRFRAKDARGEFLIPDQQVAAFDAAADPLARLQVLNRSAELQRAFLAQASFDASVAPTMRALIQGTPEALDQLRQAQQTIRPIAGNEAGQRALFEEKVQQLERGRFQPVLTARQRQQVALEQFELDPQAAAAQTARESLQTVFRKINFAGIDFIPEKSQSFVFEQAVSRGKDPVQAALDVLRFIVEDRRGQFFGLTRDAQGREVSQGPDAAELQIIQQQVELLTQLRDDLRAQTAETKRTNLRKQSGPPAANRLDRRNNQQ